MTQPTPDRTAIRRTIADKAYGTPLQGGPVTTLLSTSIAAFDPDTAAAEITFNLGHAFVNDNGVVMGGMVSAALDLAMAIVVMANTPEGATVATTNLQVQFFRPCPPGPYVAKTRIVKGGRTASFCEAQLFSADNLHVATGTCTNLVLTH